MACSHQSASDIAAQHLGSDGRLRLVVEDANRWLENSEDQSFDLIFADAMPGKYENFDLVWQILAIGGLYVIDDMLPQANWPEGHNLNVDRLFLELERRTDCQLVKLGWSSGLVLVVRTS